MPIERTAKCPQCGRPVRLTEEELMAKRGFCAVCDARFDLLPELFIGEGPMRSLMVPQVAEIAKQPPTSKMKELAPAHFRIDQALSRGFATVTLTSAILFLGMSVFCFITPRTGVVGVLTLALSIAFLGMSTWAFAGFEEVKIEDGVLERRNGTGRLARSRRIPVAKIDSFALSTVGRNQLNAAVVKALIPGEDPLVIGAGLGHSEEAMTWLARRLEKALREARK